MVSQITLNSRNKKAIPTKMEKCQKSFEAPSAIPKRTSRGTSSSLYSDASLKNPQAALALIRKNANPR